MADGVEALEGHIISVVAGLAGAACPSDQRLAHAFSNFLLLLVEHLLRHFFPHKAQIPDTGSHAQADRFSGGENSGPS